MFGYILRFWHVCQIISLCVRFQYLWLSKYSGFYKSWFCPRSNFNLFSVPRSLTHFLFHCVGTRFFIDHIQKKKKNKKKNSIHLCRNMIMLEGNVGLQIAFLVTFLVTEGALEFGSLSTFVSQMCVERVLAQISFSALRTGEAIVSRCYPCWRGLIHSS